MEILYSYSNKIFALRIQEEEIESGELEEEYEAGDVVVGFWFGCGYGTEMSWNGVLYGC